MSRVTKEILVLVKKTVVFFRRILDKAIFHLSVLETYLRQEECHRYKDCLLLHKLIRSQPPASDRYIEYPWVIEQIRNIDGKILDVGSTMCDCFYAILPKTAQIHGINLNDKIIKNKDINFKRGDIRKTDYLNNFFDYITCISTLEHIGVGGRYNSDNDPAGDKKAMLEMNRIIKKNGVLLVSIPYGIRDVLPINKLYNKERIKDLFASFEIIEQIYYKFDHQWRVWLKTTEREASQTDMIKDCWYALLLIKAIKK